MTGVDIELARAAIVIGLVLSALLYNLTRIASGGIVTGPYLALMVLTEQWLNIAGWVVLSLVGLAAIRAAAHRWPLPRSWIFSIGVLAPATLHVLLMWLAGAPQLGNLSPYLAAGLYITNGLTAYDAQRQGVIRTFAAASAVAGATFLVVLPIQWGLESFSTTPGVLSAPTLQEPLLVLAAIAIALAVRVAVGWGTAGIIGSLFFVDLLNPTSVVVMVVLGLAGVGVYHRVAPHIGLTPKQRLYSIMIVSAIVSWFGLYWANWAGIPGAEIAQQYAVEPLLVTGLMISETVRRGIPTMLAGSVLVVGTVWGAQVLMTEHPRGSLFVVLGVFAIAALLAGWAIGDVRNEWIRVLRSAQGIGPARPGDGDDQPASAPTRWSTRIARETETKELSVASGARPLLIAFSVAAVVVAAIGYTTTAPREVVTQSPDQINVSAVDLVTLRDLTPEIRRAEEITITGYPLESEATRTARAPRPLAAQVETYLRRLAGDRSSEILWIVVPDETTAVSWILTPRTVVEIEIR